MFNCDKCAASFSRHDNLKRHLKIHDDSGYICNLCNILFTRKDNLKRHTKIFHPENKDHRTYYLF
jgi:uncharacterized Zn-finger protein